MRPNLFALISVIAIFPSCKQTTHVLEKWPNGNVKMERIYVDKASFIQNSYYENGKLWDKTSFKNDKRNGKEVAYYKNGQRMGEVTYVNDTINGKCIEYFPNGNRMFEGQQIMGQLDGLIKRYHKNGRIKREEIYLAGAVTSFHEWDSSGNPIK